MGDSEGRDAAAHAAGNTPIERECDTSRKSENSRKDGQNAEDTKFETKRLTEVSDRNSARGGGAQINQCETESAHKHGKERKSDRPTRTRKDCARATSVGRMPHPPRTDSPRFGATAESTISKPGELYAEIPPAYLPEQEDERRPGACFSIDMINSVETANGEKPSKTTKIRDAKDDIWEIIDASRGNIPRGERIGGPIYVFGQSKLGKPKEPVRGGKPGKIRDGEKHANYPQKDTEFPHRPGIGNSLIDTPNTSATPPHQAECKSPRNSGQKSADSGKGKESNTPAPKMAKSGKTNMAAQPKLKTRPTRGEKKKKRRCLAKYLLPLMNE